MKKLNNFLENTKTWKLSILLFILYFVIGFITLHLFFGNFLIDVQLISSAALSFFMTIITILAFSTINRSDIFWKKAKKLESEINSTNDIVILQDFINIDIKNLHSISESYTHEQEISRLRSLIKIKIETINKIKNDKI